MQEKQLSQNASPEHKHLKIVLHLCLSINCALPYPHWLKQVKFGSFVPVLLLYPANVAYVSCANKAEKPKVQGTKERGTQAR